MARQAIGIDIGSHAVKVALLQRKGATTRAVRLFRAPLAGDTDVARVQGAISRSGVRGGQALVGITGRDLIVRYTHVPPVPDWRLKLLMQFEINEVSGQSGGQVAADYRRLNLPVESGEDTVLVALARDTLLQPRLQACRGAGLKAEGACPNSVALFNAFLAHGKSHEGKTTYLVSIGRDNLDMAIQKDGELLFARNIAGGGQLFTQAIMQAFDLKESKAEANKVQKGDLTPKGQARYPDSTSEKLANAMQGPAGQLVSMIQSSVMICRAQTKMTDLTIDRLVLTGGGARLKGIREYFEANMSVPVELFDPVAQLDTSALPAEDAQELGEAPLDFAVAIGLAETKLAPNAFRLEVLSERAKKTRHFLQRTIWAAGAAAAALVLVVLLFRNESADIQKVREANGRLQQLAKRNKSVQERGDKAIQAERDARLRDVALRSRRIPGAFLRAVKDLLQSRHPEAIFLVSEEMRADKRTLDLDGQPSADTAAPEGDPEGEARLHEQWVWPVCEVVGEVQPEWSPSPGQTLNNYYNGLRGGGLPVVEGWQIEMKTESLDRNNRFRMTFQLVPPTKAPEN
ncbi:MAG: pilus assembly protein PilM [Planctomycetota bacterium]